MVLRFDQNGVTIVGPSVKELREREWALHFEQLRISHRLITKRVRAGQLPRNWLILKALAISSPHFLLNHSADYSNDAIAEKLSQHIVFCLSKNVQAAYGGSTEPLPYFDLMGADLFVRAALNWSPVERFRLTELHGADDVGLTNLLPQMASTDPLFFDALRLATEFLELENSSPKSVLQTMTKGLETKQISRPKQPRGKRASPAIVYRRLGARLFFHEMKELGFPMGAARETNRSDTVADAVVEALRHHNWTPIPTRFTILEDWNKWKYKNT